MIETERLLIDALQLQDLEVFLALHTDPEVRRYLGGPAEAEGVRLTFARLLEFGRFMPYWAIRLRSDGQLIGLISIGRHADLPDSEVSYQLMPAYWRQGYAREALGAILDHAFKTLRLPRIVAETQIDNQPSCRLLESLGMRPLLELTRFDARQRIYALNAEMNAEMNAEITEKI